MTAPSGDTLSLPRAILDSHAALGTFILFCRIGACLMLAPGVSAAQIPPRARLFVALAATLSLAPLLLPRAPLAALGDDPVGTLRLIGVETLVGGLIGLLGRIFFLALESLAVGAASLLGFANPFGLEIEENQALPPLATLITLAALALVFVTDLHWEILRGLVASYDAMPIGAAFEPRHALRQLADVLSGSFRIALRVSSPFILYGVVVNVAISVINRLTPQIGVFYLATPFVVAGGLLLLYFTIKPLLDAFMLGFGAWLATG